MGTDGRYSDDSTFKRSGRADTLTGLAGRKVCCRKGGSGQGESKQKCIPFRDQFWLLSPVLTAQSAGDVHSLSLLLAGTLFEAVVRSSAALNVIS